jgi:RNA recognition motif-containing protein
MIFVPHDNNPNAQVIELITLRRDGLRGQAFVIFEDVQAATAALQKEQGFTFFGKDLKLAYANEKSDRIAKRDGTYVPKAKRIKKADVAVAAATDPASAAGGNNDSQPSPEAAGLDGSSDDDGPAPPPPLQPPQQQNQLPSHILFANDIPPECNEMMLAMLFRQYAGFQEVRIPRAGLAFIEFDTEPHATLALERLNGFQLTTNDALKLTYGKA